MRSRKATGTVFGGAAALATFLLVLTSVPAQATYAGHNGRIAFTANIDRAGRWDLFTMRPDGTGLKRVAVTPHPDEAFVNPDWSPDGRQILFGSRAVYRINRDGSGLTRLTDPRRGFQTPTWSPDASKIVMTKGSDREDAVWVMNADGTGLQRLTSPRYESGTPVFTPDGQHIVFWSRRDALVSALWIMNPDGSHKRRLTPPWLEAGLPDVSPDGSHLVFINNNSNPKPTAIFTMKMDGSEITRLTHPGCCHQDKWPKYSPNGKQIVFTTDRNYLRLDGTDIYEINTDGTNEHQVTTNLTVGGWPDYPFFNGVQPDWGAKRA